MIARLFAVLRGRSSQWPKVRAAHLKDYPTCAACGTRRRLEAHHVVPVTVDPTRELDRANLMTLCRTHHLTFGHLMDWRDWCPDVRSLVAVYRFHFDAYRE